VFAYVPVRGIHLCVYVCVCVCVCVCARDIMYWDIVLLSGCVAGVYTLHNTHRHTHTQIACTILSVLVKFLSLHRDM